MLRLIGHYEISKNGDTKRHGIATYDDDQGNLDTVRWQHNVNGEGIMFARSPNYVFFMNDAYEELLAKHYGIKLAYP